LLNLHETRARARATALGLGLLLVLASLPALAGTTGTLSGHVLDGDGKPVVAATVLVVGTRLGAYTDAEGRYLIMKVPPGTYELKASRLGFNAMTVSGVVVSADNTTKQDFKLGDTALATQEVVVVAERPPVDVTVTSSQVTMTTEEIEDLPVQSLTDVVNLQAGVVDGHFRGGRQGGVQFQVDGVSINNAFDNRSSLNIDRSLLQEVQVISGTFDAEYGQAMSGVVNAILKEGGEKHEVEAEVFTGGFFFPGRETERKVPDDVHLTGTLNAFATVSGPLPVRDTTFLVNARRYQWDDYITATRIFNPTDELAVDPADTTRLILGATGDGEEMPLGWTNEWSGLFKVTNRSLTNTKVGYQALFATRENRPTSWNYRFLPENVSTQHTVTVAHGFDVTHSLGATSFLDLSLRQNYSEYKDHLFEDPYDPRYDELPSPGGLVYTNGWFEWQGAQINHYLQRTLTYILKGSITSQIDERNQAKAGFELSFPKVEFGSPVVLAWVNNELLRYVNDPERPGLMARYPVMGAAYVQDKMSRNDLEVHFGARLDYFDSRSTVPSDPANPANAIAGAPESLPRETTAKASLSPRLGVAYPIEDKAAIHFSYGHFRQFPSVSTMFTNSDYSRLDELQAGDPDYGVMGNPDVRPETTVQYEVGYKQVVNDDFGYDLTIYYKDIRDLMGVEFVDTYTGATYSRLTNVDYGSALGVTLAIDHRRFGPLRTGFDYTWQQAMGNSSDPNETATRAAAGEDPRPRQIPFNWDQRHTVNATAALDLPGGWTIALAAKLGSGQPYTPETERAYGGSTAANAGRKPTSFLVDLRAEKGLGKKSEGGIFVRVFNLFDKRFYNGVVFPSTGSPYYSRIPSLDEQQRLADPTRLYQPRRLEMGVRWAWGGK